MYKTYPRIPSTPWKPEDWLATEMPWLVMVRSPSVRVSVYCSPEKEPEPYDTDYVASSVVLISTHPAPHRRK